MNPTYEDPFDNNASQKQLKTDRMFGFIYLVRSHIPSNQIFYFIFFFLKYNVAYLLTNNLKRKEDGIFTIFKVIKAATVFGNGFCPFKTSYPYFSLFIFAFMLIFMTLVIILFRRFVAQDQGQKVIVIFTYIFLVFCFISQFLCELLVPGILSYSYSIKASNPTQQCRDEFIANIVNNNVLPRYILTIMNIISFLLVNMLLYFFLQFINSPTRSFKHGNLNFNYKKVFTPAFVTYSLQGFVTSASLYSSNVENNLRLAFCIAIIVLFALSALSRHRQFNYYALNIPLQYTIFATNMNLIGGVVEVVLYFIYDEPTMPSLYYYLKLIVIFLNSVLLTYYFFVNLDIYFTNQLIGKIFIEKNKMTPGELAMYDMLLYNYLNDKCDFGELYHIYHTHKVKCTVPKCPCKILEIDKWIDRQAITEDNEHYLSVKLTKKKEEFKFSSIKDFIEIAEYEIRKNILLFKKDKKVSNFKQDLLILLHLDIIYLLKKDNCIAMYFCDRYRAQSKKINLVTRYYLYEYKILISRDLANLDKISSIDRELNEKREMTRQMKEFYHYAEFMEKVKKMIINCVFALETILKYKRKQSMKNLTAANLISCDQFLKISSQIQKTNQKLNSNLKEYLKSKEPDNPELCILVTYYFLMLNQKAPKKMVRKLEDILRKSKSKSVSSLTTTDEDNDDYISQLAYDNVNISNPMIVILNSDDNFIIIHITMKMCSILKEGKKEILKNDLHNYLPKDIIKMHKIIMKQFLLNSSSQFIKDTFITDKYSNLIPMKIVCNPLNTLETNFGLVINFIEKEKVGSLYNDYYFLLNSDFHFLGINELFAKEYFFNLQMMNIIHLDFCTFFGIKAEKLNLRLRNFFIKNKLTNKNELIEECNKEMSVFTISKMDNLFSRNKMKFLGRKNQPLKVKEKIHKRDIINNLTQLQKNINDFGLDVEWYSRIGDFRDRLLVGIENSTNNDNDIGKAKSFLNYFEAYYTINSIGNFYYIIVNLREILNNTIASKSKIGNTTITAQPAKIKPRTDMTSAKDLKFERENSIVRNFRMSKDDSMRDQFSLGSGNYLLKGQKENNQKELFFRHKFESLNSSDLSGSMSGLIKEEKFEDKRKKGKTKDNSTKKRKTLKDAKTAKNQKNNNTSNNNDEDSIVLENRKLFENKHIYSLLSHIWKFLILCQILFCFLWIIFNGKDFQTSFELYFINLYSTNIQTDIFYNSLSVFARCGIYGELPQEDLNDERQKMLTISDELRSHTKLFVNYVNNQIKKKDLGKIFDVLNANITLNELLDNKVEIEQPTTFYDEIKFYQFKVYQLANFGTFEQCSMEYFLSSESSNEEMREIFYIVKNLPSILCEKFNKVNEVAHTIFEDYLNTSKKRSIVYIFTSISVEIILMIFMQFIMSDHKANIQILLNIIYTPHKNDYLFEEDLYNYKELLFNFTKESYIHFRSMHTKILSNTTENASDSQRSLASANDTNLDNNNNNITNDSSSNEVIYRFSDNATIPKHYFITMFGMYVAGIVFIILEIIHYFVLIDNYAAFRKSNSISLNFIELFPKILEMLIYQRISILVNNKNMIQIPFDDYDNKTVYQYYDFDGMSLIQSQISKFNNSAFTYLYFQTTQIRKNLEKFMNENSRCLSKTQNWHKQFNHQNSSFCIYSTLAYLDSSLSYNEYLPVFEDLNEIASKCKKHGDGYNLNTLNIIIDASIFKIEALYGDFVADASSNNKKFLEDMEMYMIENNLKGQLKYVYSTYVNVTISDINDLVNGVNTVEIVFAICLFVSAMSYALIVFFLLQFSNKNINVLVYIKSFMEQALSSKVR